MCNFKSSFTPQSTQPCLIMICNYYFLPTNWNMYNEMARKVQLVSFGLFAFVPTAHRHWRPFCCEHTNSTVGSSPLCMIPDQCIIHKHRQSTVIAGNFPFIRRSGPNANRIESPHHLSILQHHTLPLDVFVSEIRPNVVCGKVCWICLFWLVWECGPEKALKARYRIWEDECSERSIERQKPMRIAGLARR